MRYYDFIILHTLEVVDNLVQKKLNFLIGFQNKRLKNEGFQNKLMKMLGADVDKAKHAKSIQHDIVVKT